MVICCICWGCVKSPWPSTRWIWWSGRPIVSPKSKRISKSIWPKSAWCPPMWCPFPPVAATISGCGRPNPPGIRGRCCWKPWTPSSPCRRRWIWICAFRFRTSTSSTRGELSPGVSNPAGSRLGIVWCSRPRAKPPASPPSKAGPPIIKPICRLVPASRWGSPWTNRFSSSAAMWPIGKTSPRPFRTKYRLGCSGWAIVR